MSYNHQSIDNKWQKIWEEKEAFKANASDTSKPKYYALNMFPYPSGSGLHVGHLASYLPTEVISRYKRARGFNVLHPMGYDAFGLPAEQYAIQTGVHPATTTEKAINNFRQQLKMLGYSFDWSREISTCEPKFYKWTQFIFKKLYERGLVYQSTAPVNWCPALKTVLANDEVVDGKSERGGHPVIRMPMKQWMLKITDYAERLLNDLDKLDWPDRTKEAQRNWIGKSRGASVVFSVFAPEPTKGSDSANSKSTLLTDFNIEVFTTRPDTLFGVTYLALAPEYPNILTQLKNPQKVEQYIQESKTKSEVERKAQNEKTGVFTGLYAQHPFTQERIPVFIADYVLMDYGTGAVMGVPAHDERDFAFAKTLGLPIKQVLVPQEAYSEQEAAKTDGLHLNELSEAFTGDGVLVQSDFLNNLTKDAAITAAIGKLEELGIGKSKTQYKLRDWLFSRQRYWGEPFPLYYDESGKVQLIPDNELPVVLPEVPDYAPSEKGEPPLARATDWVNYKNMGKRETDTMPGSAGSSWYFLRYLDPHNENLPFSVESERYWMPVDLYVGGAEHTVGHLLYSRFWHKVLFDLGLVHTDEPFIKLAHQGMVLGPDGEKMSKSRGNTINPDELKEKFGADAIRLYVCFLGPFEKDKPWAENGIEGVKRFLERLWRYSVDEGGHLLLTKDLPTPDPLLKLTHKTIKKVGEDIERMNFNTAISSMMILLNELYKHKERYYFVIEKLLLILHPFAPHLCEELWEKMGNQQLLAFSKWPDYDAALTKEDTVAISVQVLGKSRGTIELAPDASEEEALRVALNVPTVKNAKGDKEIQKVIYKAGKVLNIITK